MDIIIIDVKKTTMLHTHDVSARRVYSLNIRSTTREECASQRQSSRRSESKHFKVPCRRNIIRLYDKLNIILCTPCALNFRRFYRRIRPRVFRCVASSWQKIRSNRARTTLYFCVAAGRARLPIERFPA